MFVVGNNNINMFVVENNNINLVVGVIRLTRDFSKIFYHAQLSGMGLLRFWARIVPTDSCH